MKNYNEKQFVNIGSGVDLSTKDLAILIKNIIGYHGELIFNTTKPDGTPRKLMDVSYLKQLGWQYTTQLADGIALAYQDFLSKNIA